MGGFAPSWSCCICSRLACFMRGAVLLGVCANQVASPSTSRGLISSSPGLTTSASLNCCCSCSMIFRWFMMVFLSGKSCRRNRQVAPSHVSQVKHLKLKSSSSGRPCSEDLPFVTSWPFKGTPSACRNELLSGCEGSIPSGTIKVRQATATFCRVRVVPPSRAPPSSLAMSSDRNLMTGRC